MEKKITVNVDIIYNTDGREMTEEEEKCTAINLALNSNFTTKEEGIQLKDVVVYKI